MCSTVVWAGRELNGMSREILPLASSIADPDTALKSARPVVETEIGRRVKPGHRYGMERGEIEVDSNNSSRSQRRASARCFVLTIDGKGPNDPGYALR